ncbi:hypothetical protein Mal15_29590 [Stieleria maiorica]|uniref:Uncharacterized protein n=1 Tax=Stieleria maiorica TaxID=2795974 RepID=A0A5B9MC54_9BACT|nr:hypothetical protein Mal15_29590 [Stieleria maiorica]
MAREERSGVCQRVMKSRRSLEADLGGRRPQAECVIQRSHCAASYASGVTYGYGRLLAVARRTERRALPATNSKPRSPRNRFPLVVQTVIYRVTGLSYFDRGRVGMRYFIQPVSHRHVFPTRVSPLRLQRLPSADPGSSGAIEPTVTDRLCRTDSRSPDEPARTRGSAAEGSQHIPYPRTALTQSV